MRLTILKAPLLAAFQAAAPIAADGIPSTWSRCYMLTAAGDSLIVRASCGMHMFARNVRANVLEPGEAWIDAKESLARLDAMGDGDIKIETRDAKLEFSQGKRARFTVGTHLPENMPKIEPIAPTGDAINAGALAGLIARCLPAARAVDDGQTWQTGIHLLAEGGKLEAFATDGNVLALASIPFTGAIDTLLGPEAAKHIRAMLAKSKEEVRIAVVGGENMGAAFCVFGAEWSYSGRVLDGTAKPMPRSMVRKYIADVVAGSFKCPAGALSDALRAIVVGGSEHARASFKPVKFPPGVVLSTVDTNGNDTRRTVDGEGSFAHGRYSAGLMSKALQFCGGDTIEIRFRPEEARDGKPTAQGAAVLTSENGDTAAVMSCRYEPGDRDPVAE